MMRALIVLLLMTKPILAKDLADSKQKKTIVEIIKDILIKPSIPHDGEGDSKK